LSKNSELQERRVHAVPRGVSNSLAVYTERASNAELWDVEGRRYVDFASGISVLNTGHVHPKVKDAIARQLEKFTHSAFQVTPYESYIALAEALNGLAPGATPKKTIFLTTGAEAVENAIKIARYHTKRSAVIAFSGGYHGRTLGCISLTGKVQPYKAGFGPMLPEMYHLPYPMAYHGVTTEDSLQALELLFKADVDPAALLNQRQLLIVERDARHPEPASARRIHLATPACISDQMTCDPDQPRDRRTTIGVVLRSMLKRASERLRHHVKHEIRPAHAARHKRRHRLQMAPVEQAEVPGRSAGQ